ncbi:hypothetical protein [Bartonella massiliensis]|nr:hypothetical protein [Bartonella massiliensis]
MPKSVDWRNFGAWFGGDCIIEAKAIRVFVGARDALRALVKGA